MIEMWDVTKVYPNQVVALSGVTASISRGEFVFLVGPSGAGKSTFAKLVFREELPTSGEVVVGGKNLVRLREREVPFLRRNIGVVFQDFKLLSQKTAYENVAFAMQVTEAPYRDIRRRVPEVLDLVGLRDKARCYPSQLSGGEQQRIALARAIANRPAILIADEPTGNLDPDTSREIMKLFLDIHRMGTTVVVATHNKHLVDAAKKRVIALDQGRLVRDQERGVYHGEG